MAKHFSKNYLYVLCFLLKVHSNLIFTLLLNQKCFFQIHQFHVAIAVHWVLFWPHLSCLLNSTDHLFLLESFYDIAFSWVSSCLITPLQILYFLIIPISKCWVLKDTSQPSSLLSILDTSFICSHCSVIFEHLLCTACCFLGSVGDGSALHFHGFKYCIFPFTSKFLESRHLSPIGSHLHLTFLYATQIQHDASDS